MSLTPLIREMLNEVVVLYRSALAQGRAADD